MNRHPPLAEPPKAEGPPSDYWGFRTTYPRFKVALVHPFLKEAHKKNQLKFRESLALGYLTAALVEHGFEVSSVNAELRNLSPEEVCDVLIGQDNLCLVGLSSKSQRTYAASRQIANRLKERRPDLHITIGGVFATAADRQVLADCESFDSIVRGEGEEAIVELAARLARGESLNEMRGLTFRQGTAIVRNQERMRLVNLDALPFPVRRDLDYLVETGSEALASAYLVASRGCFAACTFCSIHQIYGDHRVIRRSPESIADEIKQIIDRYGVRRFSFVDDLFITPSKAGIQWVHDFCRVLKERDLDIRFYAEMRADTIDEALVRKLINAGMHRLFIGMEAGCDSVLQRWEKGTTVEDNDRALERLQRVGLGRHQINFGYIMFDPEMTLAELRTQYTWLRASGYCRIQHLQNKMNIYWGTPAYQRMVRRGQVDDSALGERWNYRFDDARVEAFEGAIRRFHHRFEESCATETLEAKEGYRRAVRVHEDFSGLDVSPWLIDLINQAYRRMEAIERSAYYFMFDALFEWLEENQEIVPSLEQELWERAGPLFNQLRLESRYLRAFAEQLECIAIVACSSSLVPGKAWRDAEANLAVVWLQGDDLEGGYRAAIGAKGSDRCDHACELAYIRWGDGGLDVESMETLRVAVGHVPPR